MNIFALFMRTHSAPGSNRTSINTEAGIAYNDIQNMEEIWSSATIEIKTDLVMAECLMRQLNYTRRQAYQQIANNKKILDTLLSKYQSQELESSWNNFFRSQRHQIHVALTVKKFILANPVKTYSEVMAQAILWFQQVSVAPLFTEEIYLYHLQETLNAWVNWEKAKKQLQGPLETLKLVLAHYQHPFPKNFLHSFSHDPFKAVFDISSFLHIRFLHEAALLWQQIANQDMFADLQANGTFSIRRLEENYFVMLSEDWQKQQILTQLFSRTRPDNNTQAIYFNGVTFKNAAGKLFKELIYNKQFEKNLQYNALNAHERIELLKKKFDQAGESTQYRIGSLHHSLASIVKRIHYYQHSEIPKHFPDVKALFLAFKQLEEQWSHEKNYPIHPRILLALHLAESNNVIVSGSDWQSKVKDLLHYLANKIKSDREAKLLLEDYTVETEDKSSWLDELETWAITVPIIGPLFALEEGIRHKNPSEILSGTVFLGLDACNLLYEESEAIGEVAFSSLKLLKNLLFRERITVENTHFTLKALKISVDDLFLEDNTLLHGHSPLELAQSISTPHPDLVKRVRSGEQGLMWNGYDLIYLPGEDRVVPVRPQGGSFREIDWQSGEVALGKHLIFKDKSNEKYFSVAGLRGGAPVLVLSESELKERVTVEKIRFILEPAFDFTTRNFNDLFAQYFLIDRQSNISTFDALEFYHHLYENSPSFRSLFNCFVDFANFNDVQRWTVLIHNNTQSRADFSTSTIYIGSDVDISNLYYMGTQGIARSLPEQVYLHEMLHALTGAKDPKKIMDIMHRGPIVYLTDKILSEAGYLFPQRLMYRRPKSDREDNFNQLEQYIKKVRSLVTQENNYLDKLLLNKQLDEGGVSMDLQKVFGGSLVGRYTIRELQSILADLVQVQSEQVSGFSEMYDESFTADDNIQISLNDFYIKFYVLSTTFRGLYNQWWYARLKNKDNSLWHFVVDDITTSLAELPAHKRAHCINDLTHRIHIFNDGTLYLSDKGLIPVERERQLMHEIVQLLTGLSDLPGELALTNRGAVVQLTDRIFQEAHFNIPKRLVSRLALVDDFKTQALLKMNWVEAQRAMQLEDSFINRMSGLSASCFPWCNRQARAIKEGNTVQRIKQITALHENNKNNTENIPRVRRNVRTELEKDNDRIIEDLVPSAKFLSPNIATHSYLTQRKKQAINKKSPFVFDEIEEQAELYLTKYNQQQAKQHAIRHANPKSVPVNSGLSKSQKRSKQIHFQFDSIQASRHKTQQNKAAPSHLFRTAIIKSSTDAKAQHLLSKQTMYRKVPTSFISSAANKMSFFLPEKATKLPGMHLRIEADTIRNQLTEKNDRFHYQNITSSGISRVTVTSDAINTLFLLDTAVRYWTRNPYRPISTPLRTDKQAERQIQMIQKMMERKK